MHKNMYVGKTFIIKHKINACLPWQYTYIYIYTYVDICLYNAYVYMAKNIYTYNHTYI